MGNPLTEHQIRALIAAEHKRKMRDAERIADLYRQLREIQLAEHIRAVVDAAPPLTQAQLQRLSLLLVPAPTPDSPAVAA
jgi:hypothetical protein